MPGRKRRSAKRKTEDVEIETVNTSGWAALLQRLKSSKADVLCAQEHRTLEHAIDERSAQARKLGWKSLWCLALPTDPNNPQDALHSSGGTAIFVRSYMGLCKVFEDEPEHLPT